MSTTTEVADGEAEAEADAEVEPETDAASGPESGPDGGPGADARTDEFVAQLRELPPSAKLIAKVLETETGPLSQGELTDESLLPERTVRYALNRLEDAELVESRYSFKDARKLVYSLSDV